VFGDGIGLDFLIDEDMGTEHQRPPLVEIECNFFMRIFSSLQI